MEKLSLWEKFKNLFLTKEQTDETSKSLLETMNSEKTDSREPLTDFEKRELLDVEAKATDGDKMEYFRSILFKAYAKDKISDSQDIPEIFALDRVYDGVKSPLTNFQTTKQVYSKLNRMSSDEMKLHIKEFVQFLSPEQKDKIIGSCTNFMDTVDSPKELNWKIDNYKPNKEEKDMAVNFVKESIIPLFSDHEYTPEKYKVAA